MFGGLWFICESQWTAIPVHAPVGGADYAGCFQMLGGMTDFYRSRRGVKMSTG